MNLFLNTPALLFPAISLLLLAYTNRFLHLASLIRRLHSEHQNAPDPILVAEIHNLRFRVGLIKKMQFFGVASLFGCVLCMLVLFLGFQDGGKLIFTLALGLMMVSLAYSLHEIALSVGALNIHLDGLEMEETVKGKSS